MDPVTLKEQLIESGLEVRLLRTWTNGKPHVIRGSYIGNEFSIHQKGNAFCLRSKDYFRPLVQAIATYVHEQGRCPNLIYRYSNGDFGAEWDNQGINRRKQVLKRCRDVKRFSVIKLRSNML